MPKHIVKRQVAEKCGVNVNPIYVTQPYLPEIEEFIPYLEKIWENKILTNCGPFHEEFESLLCDYLGIEHIALFTNGTLALVTALQALGISGEVITTPYSFVATAHALLWNGLKPVFVDINKETLNLDPEKIEEAITSDTTAILPVHCYGNPCNVEEIQKVADKYNLKIIYDAAHAFGVRDAGGSILRHGDLSIMSFHATKVFNTFEGGAIVCPDYKTKQYVNQLKNFGFVDETTVVAAGINGKMSEINASFGILQLKHVDEAISRRCHIDMLYRELLDSVQGITCLEQTTQKNANYGYFPVFIEDEYPISRDELYNKLQKDRIYGRRYFYPLISDFPMYRSLPSARKDNLTVAATVADKVICLPIYPSMKDKEVFIVCDILASLSRD